MCEGLQGHLKLHDPRRCQALQSSCSVLALSERLLTKHRARHVFCAGERWIAADRSSVECGEYTGPFQRKDR